MDFGTALFWGGLESLLGVVLFLLIVVGGYKFLRRRFTLHPILAIVISFSAFVAVNIILQVTTGLRITG